VPPESPEVTASRLDDHEKICAERYAGIKDDFKDVFKDLNSIKHALIGLLLAVVGWLIINGVQWKH